MNLPDSYLVIDTETTGLNPLQDKIVQWGWCRVKDRVATDRGSFIINHEGLEIPDEASRCHGIDTMLMRRSGLSQFLGYMAILGMCRISVPKVGHNIHRFDCLFVREIFPSVDSTEWVDTAAIYKGQKLGLEKDPTQSWQGYSLDVLERRVKGLKYSVGHVAQEYGIVVDEKLHDAQADAYYTHLILEKMRNVPEV